MNKAMERLRGAMSKANPMNALLSMAKGYLPKLVVHLEDMNQPEEKGGFLKEGQERITYVMSEHEGEIVLSVVPLRINEAGEMVMDTPLRNLSIDELVKGSNNGQ